MMYFPDLSGSAFMLEIVTMTPWLICVMSRLLPRKSIPAARLASASRGLGSSHLTRKSVFLSPDNASPPINGHRKLIQTLPRIFRSQMQKSTQLCAFLVMISKPFLDNLFTMIPTDCILLYHKTMSNPSQMIGDIP